MSIEEFIEARLDEDEQIAQAAAENKGEWWTAVDPFSGDEPDRVEGSGVTAVAYDLTVNPARQIARHDPARVLRQVAATRELFERAKPWPKCRGHPGPWMPHGDYGPGFCGTPEEADSLRVIAAIWSDHPDFQPEWNTP